MADNEIKAPCDLDQESVEFLESKLGAKVNPHLENEEDYCRAVFYFKCCGIQEEAGTGESNKENLTIRDCFFSKEKADVLFEDIYEQTQKYRDLLHKMETDPSVMDEFMAIYESGAAAETATYNEHLTPDLHIMKDGRDIGNAQILQTASLAQLNGYLQSSPDLQETLNKRYNAAVTSAAWDITPHLPDGANLQDYMPVIQEHPKAVLALAITAEANKEAKVPFTISSPEELLTKCQSSAITSLADKISFNDLSGSKKAIIEQAQPVIGLGKEQIDVAAISKAKVNEG